MSTYISALMLEGKTSLSIDNVKVGIISSLRGRSKVMLQQSLNRGREYLKRINSVTQ